jgi:hypothetical protein
MASAYRRASLRSDNSDCTTIMPGALARGTDTIVSRCASIICRSASWMPSSGFSCFDLLGALTINRRSFSGECRLAVRGRIMQTFSRAEVVHLPRKVCRGSNKRLPHVWHLKRCTWLFPALSGFHHFHFAVVACHFGPCFLQAIASKMTVGLSNPAFGAIPRLGPVAVVAAISRADQSGALAGFEPADRVAAESSIRAEIQGQKARASVFGLATDTLVFSLFTITYTE